MDVIAEQGMLLRNTMLLLYSPKCVERVFSEVHMHDPALPKGGNFISVEDLPASRSPVTLTSRLLGART